MRCEGDHAVTSLAEEKRTKTIRLAKVAFRGMNRGSDPGASKYAASTLRACLITIRTAATRFCGQSSQPDGDRGDGYDGEEVSRGFFVAGCNASEVLEFAEAAFDEMAFFVDVLVERVFFGA
jgi:hypothetical protein